jgi:L-lactate dehydrogenase complex protein LldE
MASARPIDLFATCLVEAFYPQVGEAVVEVLERAGFQVSLPPDQTCCAMPLYNNGFVEEARSVARRTVAAFPGEAPIVVPSGSCAWMLRHIYPELLPDERGRAFAARVREFSELLGEAPPAARLETPRKATYHPSCHLRRGLGVDEPPRALLRSIAGLELAPLAAEEECCGFGGTFAVRYGEVSGAMLDDKLACARTTGADTLVVTDLGCMLQLDGGARKSGCPFEVRHIAELLAEARPVGE